MGRVGLCHQYLKAFFFQTGNGIHNTAIFPISLSLIDKDLVILHDLQRFSGKSKTFGNLPEITKSFNPSNIPNVETFLDSHHISNSGVLQNRSASVISSNKVCIQQVLPFPFLNNFTARAYCKLRLMLYQILLPLKEYLIFFRTECIVYISMQLAFSSSLYLSSP